MTFELDTSDVSQSSNNTSNYEKTDYDAMNAHVIEAAGTQSKAKTLVGFPVGLYDLGLQPRAPYEEVYDPSDARSKEAVEKGEATVEKRDSYYDDGKWLKDVEVFVKPRKPAKAVAIAVDFPQITVDKGQFFGNSNPAPLRLIMGGNWMVKNPEDESKKMRIIQSPFYLNENTGNPAGEWALGNRTNLFKMGEAADLLNENGNFKASDVAKLLGKALMFKIQVFQKPDKKDPSKSYYTETIKFVSEVPEGLPTPELDSSLIHGLNMNRANPDYALQMARGIVKNTMMLSEGWEKSVIKVELERC